MSETARLRRILLSIQDRVKALGSSNSTRWAAISLTKTLTFDGFMDKLQFLGNSSTPEDVRTIWDSLDIPGDSISFIDFLKIMQQDVDDFVPTQTSPAKARRAYEPEPQQRSYEFEMNQPRGFMDDYDPPSQPRFGSFDDPPKRPSRDLDYNSRSPPRTQIMSKTPIKTALKIIIMDCMDADTEMWGIIPSFQFEDILARSGVDVYDHEIQTAMRSCTSGSDVMYFMFADSIARMNTTTVSKPVDAYPKQSRVPEVPIQRAPPKVDTRDLAADICRLVFENMGGTKNAFHRWRGGDSRLTADDLQSGLSRDCHYDASLSDIESLLAPYGGSLSLNQFATMNSTSTPQSPPTSSQSANRESAVPSARGKMTEDQETLFGIAQQITSPGWENVIDRAQNNDEMVAGLKKLGIVVDSDKLRRLTSKLGRSGLIQAISNKLN